jgi:phosphoglycerate dehydrogenase-like enzyme
MNAAAFAACKKGALFVNVTRGDTVDSLALRAALESGQLGGAAIDVTETEPLPDGDPLWKTPNLTHLAARGRRRRHPDGQPHRRDGGGEPRPLLA